jgi:putative tricarboxylic transport membrane protein
MRDRDKYCGIGFLIFAIFIGVQASRFPFGSLRRVGPGFFPLVLALLLAVLSLTLFIKAMRRQEAKPIDWPGRQAALALGLVVAAVFGYSLLLNPLGFLLTTLLFCLVVYKFSDPYGRFGPIVASLIATFASILFFKVWLGIPFPTGVLGY